MTLQNLSQLLAAGPARLLDQPLSVYADLLRRDEPPNREHLEAIDYALRHTVVRLLVRRAERDQLNAAYDALRTLIPLHREEELARWELRWRAFADLIDARLGSLAAQRPDKAKKLMHAPEILALVTKEPGLSQTEIGDRLDLKPANLSRILGVLEAHDFIERRVVGREKRVYLGYQAEAGTADQGSNRESIDYTMLSPSQTAQPSQPSSIAEPGLGSEMTSGEESYSSEIERAVAEIWKETLGLSSVGRNDDFFELGGDSIAALRLVARLREEFSVRLPLVETFSARTIATVSEKVEAGMSAAILEDLSHDEIVALIEARSEEKSR